MPPSARAVLYFPVEGAPPLKGSRILKDWAARTRRQGEKYLSIVGRAPVSALSRAPPRKHAIFFAVARSARVSIFCWKVCNAAYAVDSGLTRRRVRLQSFAMKAGV